jgi:hypothetical protein
MMRLMNEGEKNQGIRAGSPIHRQKLMGEMKSYSCGLFPVCPAPLGTDWTTQHDLEPLQALTVSTVKTMPRRIEKVSDLWQGCWARELI